MQFAQHGVLGSSSFLGGFPKVNLALVLAEATPGYRALGDSFTVGQGGTVPTTDGYAYVIGTEIGITVTNHAVGGRGVWEAARQAALNFGNNGKSLVTVMVGLNDMRRAGANTKTYNKILHGHRAIAILKYRTTIVAAGSASVTRTGTHTIFSAANVGGKYGTGGETIPADTGSYVVGSGTWSYTFTGTRVAVGMLGCDGVAVNWNGAFTITIDGNTVETGNNNDMIDGISDGSNNNQRGVMCFVFDGLSGGSHTIVVTANSGTVPVDYFAVLADPATDDCVPLMFSEIPYVEDYAKPGADQGSMAISDTTSEYILQVYQEFWDMGFPVTYVPVNNVWDYLNNVDGVHPDDLGHTQLANAFLLQMIY